MRRNELIAYLDDYLQIAIIKDYGPQGLQLESENDDIRRIALAVDVAPSIIAAAAAWQADMLLVHHGILWRNVARLAGPLGERVRLLLRHGLNLYAAHLPLDAHPQVGNNAVLAQMLGVAVSAWWADVMGTKLGACGSLTQPLPLDQFVDRVNQQLHTTARVLAHGPQQVERVAILSGFGADEAAAVHELGVDTYVTGETSHANYWAAADYGLNIIYAGHYATETVGVKALGEHLAHRFGLDTRFFDFPTGM